MNTYLQFWWTPFSTFLDLDTKHVMKKEEGIISFLNVNQFYLDNRKWSKYSNKWDFQYKSKNRLTTMISFIWDFQKEWGILWEEKLLSKYYIWTFTPKL